MWRAKVWASFGIDKKYSETWRKTAKAFFDIGMINLGKKWVNGQTYKELMDDALENPAPGGMGDYGVIEFDSVVVLSRKKQAELDKRGFSRGSVLTYHYETEGKEKRFYRQRINRHERGIFQRV